MSTEFELDSLRVVFVVCVKFKVVVSYQTDRIPAGREAQCATEGRRIAF